MKIYSRRTPHWQMAIYVTCIVIIILLGVKLYPRYKYPSASSDYINNKLEEYQSSASYMNSYDNDTNDVLTSIYNSMENTKCFERLWDGKDGVNNVESCPNPPFVENNYRQCLHVIKSNNIKNGMNNHIKIKCDYVDGWEKGIEKKLYYITNIGILAIPLKDNDSDTEDIYFRINSSAKVLKAVFDSPFMIKYKTNLFDGHILSILQVLPKLNINNLLLVQTDLSSDFDLIKIMIDSMKWQVVYYNKEYEKSNNKDMSAFAKKYGLDEAPLPISSKRELACYTDTYIKVIEYYDRWYASKCHNPPEKINVEKINNYISTAALHIEEFANHFMLSAYYTDRMRKAIIKVIDNTIKAKKNEHTININEMFYGYINIVIDDSHGCVKTINNTRELKSEN